MISKTHRFAFHNWKARLFDVRTHLAVDIPNPNNSLLPDLKTSILSISSAKKCMRGRCQLSSTHRHRILRTVAGSSWHARHVRSSPWREEASIHIMMSKQVKQIPLDFRRAFSFLHLFLAVDHWDGSNVLLFFSETKIKYA